MTSDGPLIVQSDKTLLLEVDHPLAGECRTAIAAFAELERAPEHVHTYRVTPLGLWNARAAGVDAEQVVDMLMRFSRFPVPSALLLDVAETMDRYGRLVLEDDERHGLVLLSLDVPVLEEVLRSKHVAPLVEPRLDVGLVSVPPGERGRLKQALLKVGWPVDDQAGYVDGSRHPILLHDGDGFVLRPYQLEAVDAFFASGTGVVVLPCGAGKTLVGAAAMAVASARTLILVTNTVSARQWRAELLARTSLTEEEIGEYSGERKEIRPVTIATYQILSSRSKGEYRHFGVFDSEDWGLVVYDEVHLLPAPVFRMTAEIQSRRRLGLTATLVREDGREGDVFSLIGPKRYESPWRAMESQGWIAPAVCTEVRVTLTEAERMEYAVADPDHRHRVGATAASKHAVIRALLSRHPGEPTLVIGMYVEHLAEIAEVLGAPLVTGKTPNRERERLYAAFRAGDERVLVVSKVANFSIDLPEASVAVQVSGTFGSRQEEAQRLGRILRPKADGRQAHFYAVVSRETNEQEFAAKRQRFLGEQGYAYDIVDADDVLGFG
jgi:DNA excision repair protein ERCC-3